RTLAEREGLSAARPKLEHAERLFAETLAKFGDHPRARDVAISLGDAHMLLRRFNEACVDYERAIELSRTRSATTPGGDSLIREAEERLLEAQRAWRRLWITRVAEAVLAALALALLAVRPRRQLDAEALRLGAGLVLATLLLAVLSMAGAYVVRAFIDDH